MPAGVAPNASQAVAAGGVAGQAQLDSYHLGAIEFANRGHAVAEGLEVSISDAGNDLVLSMAAGTVLWEDAPSLQAADTVTLTDGSGLSAGQVRRDWIVWNVLVGLYIVEGTPGTYTEGVEAPDLADFGGASIPLATYWMEAGETTTVAGRLDDCRVFRSAGTPTSCRPPPA